MYTDRNIFLKVFFCLSVISMTVSSNAQKKSYVPLNIGDKVPELYFDNVLNSKSSQLKVSDFKGRLLILDVWNTGCGTCIAEFPRLTRLQEKFGDRLAIVPVGLQMTDLPSTKIKKFLLEKKGTKYELKLPVIVQSADLSKNTTYQLPLYKLFPWDGMPHEIWINADGILVGITDEKAVSEDNIRRLLEKKNARLFKRARNISIGCSDVFVLKGINSNTYGSAFTSYNDSIRSNSIFSSLDCDNKWRFVSSNLSYDLYYACAYRKEIPDINKRIIIEKSGDKPFYQKQIDGNGLYGQEWMKFKNENLFCYELILPKTYSEREVFEFMKSDFDRFFQVKSSVENRKVKCLALVEAGSPNYRSMSKESFSSSSKIKDDAIELSNIPIEEFIRILNNIVGPIVVNETNYYGNIDIDLSGIDRKDSTLLRNALHRYNLDLIEVTRELPMLVLRDQRK